MPDKNRRSALLINPKFQISFLIYTASIAAITAAIFYGAIYYFFWKFRTMGAAVGLPSDHVFFRFLLEQQTSLNWCWFIVSILAVTVIIVSGMYLSHRVAGPIHHLQEHMEKIAKGESAGEVQFRKQDYFPELADAYNQQLKEICQKKKAA